MTWAIFTAGFVLGIVATLLALYLTTWAVGGLDQERQ